MTHKSKSRTKSEVNPNQGIPPVSEKTKEWITQTCQRLYLGIRDNADSPLIEINFPDFAPGIVCSRMLDLVLSRLERDGVQIPNLIVNVTK